MNNKAKYPFIQNTYSPYHRDKHEISCNRQNTIVPNYYPNPQFSDHHYHVHHPHHCCENKFPEIVETQSCNGDCGSCCSYQRLNELQDDLRENENIEYRIPILETFPWQETVKSRISNYLPIKPSKGDRYLIFFEKEEDLPDEDDQPIEELPDEEIDPGFLIDDEKDLEDIPNEEFPNKPNKKEKCECSCSLLKEYENAIVWYDGKHWNVNRPSAGWTVYVENEKLRYVFHSDTGWIVDTNTALPGDETEHKSDLYYSSKSEVIIANVETI